MKSRTFSALLAASVAAAALTTSLALAQDAIAPGSPPAGGAGPAQAQPAGPMGRGEGPRLGMRMRGEGEGMPFFGAIDEDGDGTVTKEEIEAQASARFGAADADGDGTLTADEIAAAIEAQRLERQTAMALRMIERLDQNADGVLSLEEITAGPSERMFAMIDADNDGAISAEEWESHRAQMQDRSDGMRGRQFMSRRGEHGDGHEGRGRHRGWMQDSQ